MDSGKRDNTCTALLQMYDGWTEAVDKGQFSGVCMLDMSAAFDTVNHSLLLQKMEFYGIDSGALQWVSSYLSERSQRVCIDGCMSSPLDINIGVPQGSILGPLYYIIFTNELPEAIYSCRDHRDPENPHSTFIPDCSQCGSLCCFADDGTVNIVSSDPQQLSERPSEKFTLISDYLIANRLKLNEEKNQPILMSTSSRKRLQNPSICIHTATVTINRVSCSKLLGVYVHEEMKWAEYILNNEDSLVKSLNRNLAGLRKICKYSDFKTRLMVCNGIFISKLIYLIPLLGGAEGYLIRILQVIQNKASKYITKRGPETSALERLNECGWLSVPQLITCHSPPQDSIS